MKSLLLLTSVLASLFGSNLAFGQGPYAWYDSIWTQAWWNPCYEFDGQFDPYFNAQTELQKQTLYVPTIAELGQKHKNYYVYGDHHKENGTIGVDQLSPTLCRVWLEWSDPMFPNDIMYYPSVDGTEYEAVPYSQYDQGCFQQQTGPYTHMPLKTVFVGPIYGTWAAFTGLNVRMGAAFTQNQINRLLESNKEHNFGPLKSDLRESLVNEFLALNPTIPASDIPIDILGNTLVETGGASVKNVASVCHIIPATATEGNYCGRNSYSNAMIVSSDMKDSILASGMPSPGLSLYMAFLAEKYASKFGKPMPTPSQKITYEEIRDLNQLRGSDIELLTEDETRTLLDYLMKIEADGGEPTPAPKLDPQRR